MRTMLLEQVAHLGDPQVPHLCLPQNLNPTMRVFPSLLQHPLCSKRGTEDFLHTGFSLFDGKTPFPGAKAVLTGCVHAGLFFFE